MASSAEPAENHQVVSASAPDMLAMPTSVRPAKIAKTEEWNLKPSSAEDSGAAATSMDPDRKGEGLLAMLPDEVINIILTKLTPQDIVDVVSNLSHRFKRLCSNVDLWTQLGGVGDRFSHQIRCGQSMLSLFETLKTCPNNWAMTAIVEQRDDLPQILEAVEKLGRPALDTLTLRGSWDPRVLEEKAGCLRHLINIRFRDRLWHYETWDHGVDRSDNPPGINTRSLSAVASACTHLKSLSISCYSRIADLSCLSKCVFLEDLFLDHFYLGLLGSVGELKSLKRLHLWEFCDVKEKPIFPKLPSLSFLRIDSPTTMDDRIMQAISHRCPDLRELEVISDEVTEEGLITVYCGCPKLTELELLPSSSFGENFKEGADRHHNVEK